MPVILKHEAHKFEQKQGLINKHKTDSHDYYKSPYLKTIENEEGGNLFSSIGTLAKTGINFIGRNKDIISNVAQGVAGVGSMATSIAKAVEASKKLEQIKQIRDARDKKIQQKSLSEKTKRDVEKALGNGFVKVE